MPGNSGAARAPDAMDVVLGHERQVVVDHERKLRDVETSRGNVGGHEDADTASLEVGEATGSLRLTLSAVDDGALHVRALETIADAIGTVLRLAENQRLAPVRLRQYVDEQRVFPILIDGMNAMRDRRRYSLVV
jgi:hypothetical protein